METVGLVGLGFLGRGIAACLLAHGFRVVAFAPHEEFEDASRFIADAIGELINRSGLPIETRTHWPANLIEAGSYERLRDAAFVIESVVEDPAIKQSVFDDIESAVAADVVIASNTSSIPISQLQRARKHPARFLGMHWAEPAHLTRFAELIRGEQTSNAALQSALLFCERLGKEPCQVNRDVPGFIANRLAYAMYREALHLLETGVADAETIDRSFRNSVGLWAQVCGPFRWIDLTGGPALYGQTMERVLPTLNCGRELPAGMKSLMEEGKRGSTSGSGFYEYTPEETATWHARLRESAWAVRDFAEKHFPLPSVTRRSS